MKILEVKESPIYQAPAEIVVRELTTTPWGGSPSAPVVTVFDDAGADVTATVCTGSASVSGATVITPAIGNLTEGADYDVRIEFVSAGNTLEARLVISCR